MSIDSEIPIGKGLGSSGALAVALCSACCFYVHGAFDLGRIERCAFETEKLFHGNPSGIDSFTSLHGGFVKAEKGVFTSLPVDLASRHILLIDSCVKRHTRDQVAKIEAFLKADPEACMAIFTDIGSCAKKALEGLDMDDFDFNSLVAENQNDLRKLGISNDILENIIEAVRDKLGVEFKITGAGGGGFLLGILNARHNVEEFAENYKEIFKGNPLRIVRVSGDGIRLENKDIKEK